MNSTASIPSDAQDTSAMLQPHLSSEDAEALSTQAGKASEILKAMSHSGRLMILCVLLDGEKNVTEIEEAVGMSQSTVSQHLARLRLDRLLTSRRDGRLIHYSISDPKVVSIIMTLHELFCKTGNGDDCFTSAESEPA